MPPSEQDIRNRLLVARLPALPHILLKLMEYCRSEEVGMVTLAELVAKDPAIATKVLRVANSVAFLRGGQKTRLDQSLMSLGTDTIRTLVISESVFQTINSFTTSNSTNLCEYWMHSLTSAVIARDLARKMKYSNVDEAYLGGLLHDVGRLAFLAISPNEYIKHFHAVDDDALCVTEQSMMQITHSEAGAWLIERWKLDSYLADSVLYHHEPVARLETAHPLIRIVFLAHRLASQPYSDPIIQQAAALCKLTPKDLETIQNGAAAKVRESAEFLGIDLSTADHVPPHIPHVQPSAAQKKLNDELQHIIQSSETERTFARQANESELLETVTRSARILFQLDDAIILLLDTVSRTLVASHNGEHRQRLADFSLSLVRSSAVAEASVRNHPTFISSKYHPLAIADEQLFRILESEWLVCLPLVSGGQCLGMIIGSSSRQHMADLHRNAGFLQAYATQAASALRYLRRKQTESNKQAISNAEEFRISSRKVAHEVNNPLAIIKNYLTLLNNKLAKQEPVGDEVIILNDEIDRVSKIISEFADPQPPPLPTLIDINKIILDVVRIFRDTGFAPKTVSIVTSIDGQPTGTECDEGAIRQILINLLKNAVEVMPNGGEIAITNRGHVNHNGTMHIGLSVKDTGPGIPAAIIEKLFSPVSSTKGSTHQGLGLSIVQDLVKGLNGVITCRNSNSGALFDILLPVLSRSGHAASDRLRV